MQDRFDGDFIASNTILHLGEAVVVIAMMQSDQFFIAMVKRSRPC
jgi:hypothetical protein